MGTRSTIALLRNDGTVAQIYCHWDGYLEHNGQILNDFYNTYEKAEELIGLGGLSSLKPNIGIKHAFHSDVEAESEMCTAYNRDRGEDLVINVYPSLQHYETNACFEEYNYMFMYNTWTYCTYDGPARLLEDGLREVNRVAA